MIRVAFLRKSKYSNKEARQKLRLILSALALEIGPPQKEADRERYWDRDDRLSDFAEV